MKKAIVTVLFFFTAVLVLCGCGKCEHIAGEWITDTEATCSAPGTKHKVCLLCGETVATGEIEKTEHTAGEWITDTEATCSAVGAKHQVCSVCGETVATEEIEKAYHKGVWVVDLEPTCNETGSWHQECSVCGEILKTSVRPKLSHTYVTLSEVPATCTEDGVIEEQCCLCGETQTRIVEAGHKYDSNGVCKSCGLDSYTCVECNGNFFRIQPLPVTTSAVFGTVARFGSARVLSVDVEYICELATSSYYHLVLKVEKIGGIAGVPTIINYEIVDADGCVVSSKEEYTSMSLDPGAIGIDAHISFELPHTGDASEGGSTYTIRFQ